MARQRQTKPAPADLLADLNVGEVDGVRIVVVGRAAADLIVRELMDAGLEFTAHPVSSKRWAIGVDAAAWAEASAKANRLAKGKE